MRHGSLCTGIMGLDMAAEAVYGGELAWWSEYEDAPSSIRRWERTLRRCAPAPVDHAGRLSPHFVEWMMGYPEGWTADLGRTKALKALGNAVCPQQGEVAIRLLEAAHLESEAAA